MVSTPLKEIDSPYYKADTAEQYYLFTKGILNNMKEDSIKAVSYTHLRLKDN